MLFEKKYEITLALNEEAKKMPDGSYDTSSHSLIIQPYYQIGFLNVPDFAWEVPFFSNSMEKEESKIKKDLDTLLQQRSEIARMGSGWYPTVFRENAKSLLAESLLYQAVFKKDMSQIVQESRIYCGEDAEKIEQAVIAYSATLNKPYELVA